MLCVKFGGFQQRRIGGDNDNGALKVAVQYVADGNTNYGVYKT